MKHGEEIDLKQTFDDDDDNVGLHAASTTPPDGETDDLTGFWRM